MKEKGRPYYLTIGKIGCHWLSGYDAGLVCLMSDSLCGFIIGRVYDSSSFLPILLRRCPKLKP